MFPCSADHKQDWQPHPVDAQSAGQKRKTSNKGKEKSAKIGEKKSTKNATYVPLDVFKLEVVCVCVWYHFQQTGHQPGVVANPCLLYTSPSPRDS